MVLSLLLHTIFPSSLVDSEGIEEWRMTQAVRGRACSQGKGLGEQLHDGAYPFCLSIQHDPVALSIDSWKVMAQKCPLAVQSNPHVNYRAEWLSLLMVTQPVSGQLG